MTLPNGWATVKLGECSDLIRGISFPSSAKLAAPTHDSIICLRTSNVQDTLETDDVLHVPRSFLKSDEQRVRRNDIVISMSNSKELVGKTALALADLERTAIGGFLAVLRVNTIEARFVQYLLRTSDVRERLTSSSSITTNIANLSSTALRDLDVPLPPLPEQHRIVAVLDTYFTQLDAAVATLARVQANLKRHRAAILQAAIEGRLARRKSEERSDGLPAAWTWTTIKDLSPKDRPSAYGVLQPGVAVPGGVPLVRVMDIGDGTVDVPRLKRIAVSIAERYPRTRLRGGEVLLSIVGTIGRTAIVPSTLAGANTARAIAVIPVRDGVDPRWVELVLRAPRTVAELTRASHEVARKTLNLEDVRKARIPMPPRDEQNDIVAEAERMLSKAAHADRVLAAGVQRIARLRQSLLRTAFEGRLVPQVQGEEPASALLDHLRRERTVAPSPPKKKLARSRR